MTLLASVSSTKENSHAVGPPRESADLSNLVNEAALLSARTGKKEIGQIESQPLLIPATFAATPHEIATAEAQGDSLRTLGLAAQGDARGGGARGMALRQTRGGDAIKISEKASPSCD